MPFRASGDSKCGNSVCSWFNGDFNYDGAINGSDYTLIDNAFNQQGTSLASQIATAARQPARPVARPASLFSDSQLGNFRVGSAESVPTIEDEIFSPDPQDLLDKSLLKKRLQ